MGRASGAVEKIEKENRILLLLRSKEDQHFRRGFDGL
jgi:hypothetical protein